MSQRSFETVKTGVAHFVATGEPMWSATDEDVEVRGHDLPGAGVYRGHAGYGQWALQQAGRASRNGSERRT